MLIIFYSGADSHRVTVPETVLKDDANVMLSYGDFVHYRNKEPTQRFLAIVKKKAERARNGHPMARDQSGPR